MGDSMTPSIDVHQCDDQLLPSLLPAFTSERAELVHIRQQITSLGVHDSQLSAVREELDLRSRQLHNLLSPICNLPVEVLSYIFQQLVDPDHHDRYSRYRLCVAQAFILSSVSSHFRRVAFDTPDLWENIPFYITHDEATRKALLLLRHCIALTPSVNISAYDSLNATKALSAAATLLTPDVTRKVKSFTFCGLDSAPIWIDKLESSPFPRLEALYITCSKWDRRYDFGPLKALTRLSLDGYFPSPIKVPPSLQYLSIARVTPRMFLSLIYQCSSLVECEACFDLRLSENWDETPITEPLTLNHLKRMGFHSVSIAEISSFLKMLRLPSLETLQLEYSQYDIFSGACPFLRGVSATLTKLVIVTFSETVDYDDLYQACRLPFPKLRKLEFCSRRLGAFVDGLHALALLDGEYSSSETRHSPARRTILLYGYENIVIKPRFLIDLLEKWRIGEAFHFRIHVTHHKLSYRDWSPELREELKSIVGGRRIEVRWSDFQVV